MLQSIFFCSVVTLVNPKSFNYNVYCFVQAENGAYIFFVGQIIGQNQSEIQIKLSHLN